MSPHMRCCNAIDWAGPTRSKSALLCCGGRIVYSLSRQHPRTTPRSPLFTKRRTQYALGKHLPIAEAEVDALIRQAILLAPLCLNSLSSRAVILFGAARDKL